ncbi:(2Fe-2S) ferredoxin domain-containing protein [Thermoanaerobacterium sp. RBIITD]|uniref:(2Fe-2S) ferredoxin domain-containing protein n=1 Tax=Thermoanaerobacterium sp. RBIITD TaxID=1550240 RepID=UPI000BB96195|nr:(2Fe-2S) ferredoxin domain-containing protein [Thermoanaerobacterium sp. RBIITD]SNX55138.1 NAD(P)-dependent iron-only hydrogenase iron-sulfur protein [Thermoanaerobacterium sp. RBIITD]
MKSIEELEKIRKETLKKVNLRKDRNGIRVTVGMATCGIAAGARSVIMAILDELGKRNFTDVVVAETGCIGMCKLEPIVDVYIPGKDKVTYVKVDESKARQIVLEHVINGHPIKEWTIENYE